MKEECYVMETLMYHPEFDSLFILCLKFNERLENLGSYVENSLGEIRDMDDELTLVTYSSLDTGEIQVIGQI